MADPIPAEKTNLSKTPDASALHQQLPLWFTAVFAISYVSGYLIEYLYYASLGIVDTGGDIFKLKYIQTGIIFLFSCSLIATYVVAVVGAPRMNIPLLDPPQTAWHISRPIVFAVMFNVVSIYISVLFTPLHYVETTAQWAGIIALVILFLIFGIIYFLSEKHYEASYTKASENNSRTFSEIQKEELRRQWDAYILGRDAAAWFFSCLVLLSDFVFLRGRDAALRDLLFQGGWIFLIFSILIPILVYRIFLRLDLVSKVENQNGDFLYYMIVSSGGILLALLLYVVLICYSYWVFPFIPSIKGGGDYENASRVSVVLKKVDVRERLGDVNLNSQELEQALIIYSSSSSYYFARPTKNNNPCDWRAGHAKPWITEVRRDEVRALMFGGESRQSNCE
ncbi:MAG TPA: hypothetical protein VFQ87_14490 [Bradyrhizobium sp.]|nr:hypothetical protein [Bradyrhizobium sp.]